MIYKNRFSNNLAVGKFYVYALIDPRDGRYFYIGKGHGNRYKHHFLDSSLDLHQSHGKEKIKRIKEIKNLNMLPGVKFLYFCKDEDLAFDVENFLITIIGTKKENTGPLLNLLTGESSRVGRCWTNKNAIEKMSQMFSGENNPCYGRFGKEHPAFGIKHSRESVEKRSKKLSEILKNNPRLGERNSNFGNKWSEEQKLRASENKKGKYDGSKNPNAKKFILISPENEEFIITGGLNKFCKEKNICYKMIWEKLKQDIHIYKSWFFKEIKNENT